MLVIKSNQADVFGQAAIISTDAISDGGSIYSHWEVLFIFGTLDPNNRGKKSGRSN